jgi:hypothetical protein
MKIQFEAKFEPREIYAKNDKNRSVICRSAIMGCNTVLPADKFLCTISSRKSKGSMKYELRKKKVCNLRSGWEIYYGDGDYIFDALQTLLLPFFGKKNKVNVYLSAENIQ